MTFTLNIPQISPQALEAITVFYVIFGLLMALPIIVFYSEVVRKKGLFGWQILLLTLIWPIPAIYTAIRLFVKFLFVRVKPDDKGYDYVF